MKQKLLLLDDVDGLGRSGDIVTAKPGFVRNFLLPQKKALVANKQALKLQIRLKEEREKKAAVDKEEALKLAEHLTGFTLKTVVKVDPEGHMYGSVTALDISRMLQEQGYQVDKRHVVIAHPVKTVGSHSIPLKLNEGVQGMITLEIVAETHSA